jgi:GNAT superfamily N-acetyltransferase
VNLWLGTPLLNDLFRRDPVKGIPLMKIRPAVESDRDWAAGLVARQFGSPVVISRGVLHDTRSLPGLVAECEGDRVGLIHYDIVGARCEVVTIVAVRPRQGMGRRMLAELGALARTRACLCLWLVTTNDNPPAQQFYEALGWRLVAVHHGAVAAARPLKPEIPERAADGTPILDELEYEYRLDTVG